MILRYTVIEIEATMNANKSISIIEERGNEYVSKLKC